MNRRDAGRALLVGGLPIGVPAPLLAQATRGAMGPAEQRHATETLKIAGLSMESSRVAQGKASGAKVKQFAGFEAAEAMTIAEILREASGMAPPPPDAEARAMLTRLNGASGRSFDTTYVAMQTDAHQKLLGVQERYLSEGRVPGMRHVAMLARVSIKEHLALLADIRCGRA